jgi:hypothetical protein
LNISGNIFESPPDPLEIVRETLNPSKAETDTGKISRVFLWPLGLP